MENISTAIKALFEKIDGDDILAKAGFIKEAVYPVEHLDSDIKESTIMRALIDVDKDSTLDQLTMLVQIVQYKWMEQDDTCLDLAFRKLPSVFNILLHFSSKCLCIKDGDPLCRYQSLLRWHLLTTLVSEDLFTTSYLASRDIVTRKVRKSFDWDAFIGHDCKELNYIFQKPMAELHMHLKGSSLNFDLNWLCLMNHIGIMEANFAVEHPYQKFKTNKGNLYEMMTRACAIRYYLAGATGCLQNTITEAELYRILKNDFNPKNGQLEDALKLSLQKRIDGSYSKTKKLMLEKYEKTVGLIEEDIIDYLPITHYEKEPVENKVLASERSLMYAVFKTIILDSDGPKANIGTLFYAYLAYKNYFRNEILQLNDRVGFANFACFEERKTDYLIEKQYNHLLYKSAIEGFLERGKTNRNDMTNRFLEARIVPKDTEEGIISSLRSINKEIDLSEYGDRFSYIFHFIKKRDEPEKTDLYQHYKLRRDIKRQSYAIYNFRNNKNNWLEKENLVGQVVGLDAANSEIFCRPEVYGQAFRFLRSHDVSIDEEIDDYPNDLRITYHVGEDFMDIADGLRAVEEALIFLNLKNGDRLGHALVLGTDVKEYYAKRYFSICASRQVILDNLAWLHHKCIRLVGYSQLCGWMEIMFIRYFSEIYQDNRKKGQSIIDSFFNANDKAKEPDYNIDNYYLSWLLRGNSPIIGNELDSTELEKMSPIDKQWAYAGFNHNVGAESALRNETAREMFDAYHSSRYAEKRNIGDTLTIPSVYRKEWIELLEKIQQHLLEKIEKRHIAIECNPSSNFKIGEMERYDQHPIVRFFNYGLSTPYPRHDISVSINTDDQGVFSTSIEREFSLMALAIERNQTPEHLNSPRSIIEWLDRVREMAIEQRFNY